jgi:hypothetical protein
MKIHRIITIFLTLLIALSLTSFISTVSANPITIYVDDSNMTGPWDGTKSNPYQTIQDGVNAANDYDIVYVNAGTYTENIDVNGFTNLKILAENNGQSVVIIAPSTIDSVFEVKSDGVIIEGFEIKCYHIGISCEGNYNQFKNNLIHNTSGGYGDMGIYVNGNYYLGNKIIGNELRNLFNAIFIRHADSTIISNNVVYQASIAISLTNYDISTSCNNNKVRNNEIYLVEIGIILYADKGLLKNNIISFNNIHTPDEFVLAPGIEIYPYLGKIEKTKIMHNTISGYLWGIANGGDYGIIHHNDAINIYYQDYGDSGVGNKDFKNSWN